jgi:hypothetical protein
MQRPREGGRGVLSSVFALVCSRPCELDVNLTTYTRIACRTAPGAYGRSLEVIVTVAGHASARTSPSNRINYSFAPKLFDIKGCPTPNFTDPTTGATTLNGTSDCPTSGNIPMTVRGVNLFQVPTRAVCSAATPHTNVCVMCVCVVQPLQVLVSGSKESPVTYCPFTAPGTCVTFQLRENTGRRIFVLVQITADSNQATAARYSASDSRYLLGFGVPKVTQIIGCTPVSDPTAPGGVSPTSIQRCGRLGVDTVTLLGTAVM